MMDCQPVNPEPSQHSEIQTSSLFRLNQIYFYLTEGCNLACRHCWLAPQLEKKNIQYPTLPSELFEKAIQEARPLGLNSVKLTGGEPLLHPQFTRFIEIIRQEDLGLTVETNGVLCTPAIAKEISKLKNRFVSVSLDGAEPESHDRMRGVKGSFKKAQQAIKYLAEAGIHPQVIMTITRFNKGQIEDLIFLAKRWGASSVKFNVIQPTARGKTFWESPDALNIAEYISLGQYIDLQLAPHSQIPLFYDYPLAFRPLSRLANKGDSICGILGIIGVIPSGHYALCGIGKHVPDLVFGKIGVIPLKKIWHENEILNALREGLPKKLDGICKQCLMRSRCLGNCIAQNYYNRGSLWGPYWFCDQAQQAGLFPKTRLRDTSEI
jgi:SynChlorMet cassette radical SAM/SPASM protein ScmF